MDSIMGNKNCFFGVTTVGLSVFFMLFISGCGKQEAPAVKIDPDEQKISRQIDLQNNAKRTLVLEQTRGKTPGEVDSILGAHISEQTLLDLFSGRSTKYYSQDELVYNRGYNIQEKKVLVFFNDGLVCGWAQ